MAEDKKSFVLYKIWHDEIERLTDIEAGILMKSILRFVNNEPIEINENIKTLFEKYTESILKDWAKYNPKTGNFHWNYKGGITPENRSVRNSASIALWRALVFERDNYTCQKCGQVGGKLNAHHIKPFALFPEFRTNVINGITLCEPCHKAEHRKEVLNG